MKAFENYDWPGNVRELENVIRRLVVLRDEGRVLEELAHKCRKRNKLATHASGLKYMSKEKAHEVEKEMILKTLDETNWNRRKAAQLLNLNYKTLLYKLKKIL
jgi:DNA-binding NtrC family response regulator